MKFAPISSLRWNAGSQNLGFRDIGLFCFIFITFLIKACALILGVQVLVVKFRFYEPLQTENWSFNEAELKKENQFWFNRFSRINSDVVNHQLTSTLAAFPLQLSQHKSNISKISTKFNCDLQAFLLQQDYHEGLLPRTVLIFFSVIIPSPPSNHHLDLNGLVTCPRESHLLT